MSVGRVLLGVATGGVSEAVRAIAKSGNKNNSASAAPAAAASGAAASATNVRDDSDEERKKRLGRASLYLTSPSGDLSAANTASGKVLGN